VIAFDPTSIAIDENRPVFEATCEASITVPRPSAFRCTFESGGVGDPCFVIKDETLICGPNPVHGSYQALVTATEPLPEGNGVGSEPFIFYVDLGADMAPCGRRPEPFRVGEQVVTYGCQAPGAWIVGELDRSRETWVAQHITTDTQLTQITSGPEPKDVARAWVH
jgi:hypothetical protein